MAESWEISSLMTENAERRTAIGGLKLEVERTRTQPSRPSSQPFPRELAGQLERHDLLLAPRGSRQRKAQTITTIATVVVARTVKGGARREGSTMAGGRNRGKAPVFAQNKTPQTPESWTSVDQPPQVLLKDI